MPLLEIRDLRTHFFVNGRVHKAVDGISLTIEEGETVALVGESGCGKSVTAQSILRLVPEPPGRIVGGVIIFEGRDLLGLDGRALRAVRGNRIGMIFQEPMTSLNPVFTIGDQIGEALVEHRPMPRGEARRHVTELLDRVRMPNPDRIFDEYPHRLSGGMRQRAMIAMAIACEPKLLIADEPTTALDVSTQAQILALIEGLKRELGMAVLIITHDLGIVAQTAQRVAVMYAGRKVEEAPVADLFARPRHPYTEGLLASLPDPETTSEVSGRPPPLHELPGLAPPLDDLPPGCAFAARCAIASEDCRVGTIALHSAGTRQVACINR